MPDDARVNRVMDETMRRVAWTWALALGCAPKIADVPPSTVADVVDDTASAPSDPMPPEEVAAAAVPEDVTEAAAPESAREPVAAPDQPPAPPQVELADVPAFARLDFAVRSLGKRRARIHRLGTLYAPAALTPLSPPSDRGVLLEVPVLDADEGGTPRRPRVLCEEDTVRVGIAIDVTDLDVAPRANVFVHPYPTRRQDEQAKTPGLRLAGGARIETLGTEDGSTRLRYAGLFLVATGWVDDDELDVVYVPDELPDDDRRNGEIVDTVDVLDAPQGEAIGRITKDSTVANRLLVFHFGPGRDDHTLVRYHDHDAFIVGWVRTDALDPFPTQRLRGGGWGGGSGSGSSRRVVALARGTYLVPLDTSEVVGVVTSDYDAACTADCDGPFPQVREWVCGSAMNLRAVAPDLVAHHRGA